MELLRPVNGIMAIIGVIIGAALGGVDFFEFQVQLAVAAAVVFLISGAGMVLNDYFDLKIDSINRPDRPLTSGRVKVNSAVIWAAILYGMAMGLSLFFLNPALSSLAIINIIVTFVYAWWIKRTAAGNFAVSWLVASTFIFGALLGTVSFSVVAVAGMAFFINVSREVTKSIEDYKGDKVNGANTLVVSLGRDVAILLSLASMFIGIGLSVVPYVMGKLGYGYVLLIIPSDVLALWAGWKMFRDAGHSQRLLKFAMVLALGAFLLGLVF